MARFNRPRVHRSNIAGPVRDTLWFQGASAQTTIATVSTATLVTSLSAGALAFRPFTVVRTRGVLHLRSDQFANSESQSAAYGRCVVSDQAVAIGVTAVPTPITDNGSDLWFVYEMLKTRVEVSSAVGIEGNFG